MVLVSTSGKVTPTFHILFLLGIVLAAIVCAYSFSRLFLLGHHGRVHAPSRLRHRHRHRQPTVERSRPARISIPMELSEGRTFIPPRPIQVQADEDDEEVRPDTREAHPTTSVRIAEPPAAAARASPKPVTNTIRNPPPAYGRWRGSVRADPDLLHWRVVVPSPASQHPRTPVLPSPTYEEAIARPPSYVTRHSPERNAELRAEEDPAVDGPISSSPATAEEEEELEYLQPEMFQLPGAGVGLAL